VSAHKYNSSGEAQACCPFCKRWIDPDAKGAYFHCAEAVPEAEWDQHYQAAFCNEDHATRFHAKAKP
jgi:hypothetical protein